MLMPKASTAVSEGNIEYWYCSECGKYYVDPTAKKEITKEKNRDRKTQE